MESVIGKFEIKYLQILDENARCDEKAMPKLSSADMKKMYEFMVLTRVFDDKAVKLQRQGRIGTYAPMLGQEAANIGSAFAIQDEDLVFPAFRENGVFLLRGMPADLLYAYWAGDERGMEIPKGVNMFPVAITVGAHTPHAVGAAMAFKLQKKKAATIVYFGDGATSEGDFHEAMNFAGVFNSPCVFICQNNQWAISVPFKEQTRSATVAQKAIAYGFEGIKVDGNDAFAVYKATDYALKKARSGGGPTLIECFTYRMGDHTTADDAKKYRTEKELEAWKKKDPIMRLEKYLKAKKIINDSYIAQVKKKAEADIEKAVAKMEAMKPYKPEEIFNYMYANITPELKEQQDSIKKEKFDTGEKKETSKVGDPKKSAIFGNSNKRVGVKGVGVVGELEEAS